MRHFNTPPIYNTSFEEINSEKGFIKGVSIATLGEIKGHGVWADSKFLSQIVTEGKQFGAGVKARFGHPNMSSTALGTYLGRFKNFRKSGDQAKADLFIDNSAKNSPNGNLYDYVFSMASENPDMFGASIVFVPDRTEFKKTGEKDTEGNEIEQGFARISQLLATDLVDEPAANEGLFETFSHDDLASQVTMFLDSHPEVWEIAEKQPEVMEGFMNKYNQYKERQKPKNKMDLTAITTLFTELKDGIINEIKALKTSKPEDPEKTTVEVKILDNENIQNKLKEFETKLEEFNTANEALTGENEILTASETTMKEKVTTLEKDIEEKEADIERLNGTQTDTKNVIATLLRLPKYLSN